MIHPAEHISLGVSSHAEELNSVFNRALEAASPFRTSHKQSDYLKPFLEHLTEGLQTLKSGRLHVSADLKTSSVRPVIHTDRTGKPSMTAELSDLIVFIDYIDQGTVCKQNMMLYRILMSQPEGDLWHVPKKQVRFLSGFAPFYFGLTDRNEPQLFEPVISDRFTGTLWFVNRSPQDFVLSALALHDTGKTMIRLSEIQHHFRYRSEIAMIRQMMGRMGDSIDENRELIRFKQSITQFMEVHGGGPFENYHTTGGKPFFVLTVTLGVENPPLA